MGRNGRHAPPRPRIELRQSAASPEEAAAITAAIEQFLRDTAPPAAPVPGPAPWLRVALLEGAAVDIGEPDPWGDSERWGNVARGLR
jgi:hypothetical protein